MRTMKYEVTIAEVDNGYVVRIGCKLLVFPTWDELSKELTAYAKGEETKLSKKMQADNPVCVAEDEGRVRPTTGESPRNLTEAIARGH